MKKVRKNIHAYMCACVNDPCHQIYGKVAENVLKLWKPRCLQPTALIVVCFDATTPLPLLSFGPLLERNHSQGPDPEAWAPGVCSTL